MNSCLSRKAKLKLADYDMRICEELRSKILSDFGHPQIKEKALDLITKLEKES